MELEFAINHAREAGERLSRGCDTKECGLEHMQLAEWLEELKERRERDAAIFGARTSRKKWTFRVRWQPFGSSDEISGLLDPAKSEEFVTFAVLDCDAWNALIDSFHRRSEWFVVEYVMSEPA